MTTRPTSSPGGRQQGAVLIISLIVLVVLMLAGVALVRSSDTAALQAGNLAFQRDVVNQSEVVTPLVRELLNTGALSTAAATQKSEPTLNYSARVLASNAMGIPLVLVGSDADFAAVATAGDRGLFDTNPNQPWGWVRYIIDRQCVDEGPATKGEHCIVASQPKPPLCGTDPKTCALAVPERVVYRVSVRVTGPRGTQQFFQSNFSR